MMSLLNDCPECGNAGIKILAEHPDRHPMSLDVKCTQCGHVRPAQA